VAQGSNALGALARIPILVLALSPTGYGTYSLVQAVVAWLLVLGVGLRYSMRTMGAEALHSSSGDDGAVLDAHVLEARRLMAQLVGPCLLGIAVLSLVWPKVASPTGSTAEAVLILTCTVLICLTTLPGNVRTGLLESRDQLGLVNLLGAATGVAGLALTFVLWKLHAPYALFAVAGVAAAAAPAWCAGAVPQARRSPMADGSLLRQRARGNARRFLVGALSLMLAAGLAPFVIGALLSAQDVATFTIAARLTVVVTLLPASLTPWLWNRQARLRAVPRVDDHLRSLDRVLWTSLGCGALLAVGFAVVGPVAGHLLGATDVVAPRGLYGAFALYGLVHFAQAPLSASLTGPRGARFMNMTTTCASVAALILAFPLTKVFGVSGPVWALAACYGVMVTVWWFAIRRSDGYWADSHLQQ
jgi:O-antigen/teichoic acid export membrane protein